MEVSEMLKNKNFQICWNTFWLE